MNFKGNAEESGGIPVALEHLRWCAKKWKCSLTLVDGRIQIGREKGKVLFSTQHSAWHVEDTQRIQSAQTE